MTQEEKAKRYDEVLAMAKECLKDGTITSTATGYIETIFPELKESDGERIRKNLIELFHDTVSNDEIFSDYGLDKTEVLDWLEKDEHKPAEKIEPKFQHGQWIVWQNKCYKVNYNGCGYELVDQNGLSTSLEYGTIDENAHIWDITKDAKAGDVLVSGQVVFIFKMIHGVWLNCYCSLHNDGSFIADSYDLLTDKYFGEVYPATKEERDTLFVAMKEAGYEWDADALELKKIKPKLWSDRENKKAKGYYIDYISDIIAIGGTRYNRNKYNLFATKKQAKSALAMARISQIMANDIENFGGVVSDREWENGWQAKYCITRRCNKPYISINYCEYAFLAFHTEQQCDLFLEKYPQLVKDYLMISDEETK